MKPGLEPITEQELFELDDIVDDVPLLEKQKLHEIINFEKPELHVQKIDLTYVKLFIELLKKVVDYQHS